MSGWRRSRHSSSASALPARIVSEETSAAAISDHRDSGCMGESFRGRARDRVRVPVPEWVERERSRSSPAKRRLEANGTNGTLWVTTRESGKLFDLLLDRRDRGFGTLSFGQGLGGREGLLP